MKTECDECRGTGQVEVSTTDGDVLMICQDCEGEGFVEVDSRIFTSHDALVKALIMFLGDKDMQPGIYGGETHCRHCGAVYDEAEAPADSSGCLDDCPGFKGHAALKLSGEEN